MKFPFNSIHLLVESLKGCKSLELILSLLLERHGKREGQNLKSYASCLCIRDGDDFDGGVRGSNNFCICKIIPEHEREWCVVANSGMLRGGTMVIKISVLTPLLLSNASIIADS